MIVVSHERLDGTTGRLVSSMQHESIKDSCCIDDISSSESSDATDLMASTSMAMGASSVYTCRDIRIKPRSQPGCL